MPDFLPVLIIGIICLVILMVVFGGGFVVTPRSGTYSAGTRTVELGNNFTISYITGEEQVEKLGGEVNNGIFAKTDKSIGFEVSDLEDVTEGLIKIKIWNTNHYGSLILLVNGNEVYRGYPVVGERLISFDKEFLKEENILEIKAEDSGWKIWAPTVYIFDAEISVDYSGEKKQTFTFDLNDLEIRSLNRGRLLIFGERTGTGFLSVRVNGVEVFNGLTTVYTDFPVDILKTGNNTVVLSTEANTRYDISSAKIVLFF